MNTNDLLYTLEQVRAVCRGSTIKFRCYKSDTETLARLNRLEEDGLVRLYLEEEESSLWEPR